MRRWTNAPMLCRPSHVATQTRPAPASIAAIAGDAAWLAHRYDPGHDAIHFKHVTRANHRTATFLTDENLPADAAIPLRRAEALAAAPSSAPIHFVFHSAFCLSTLIARAYDRPGWAMGLKEPVILNDLIGWKRRGAAWPDVVRVLDGALTLLARPFAPGEAVLVKPSNITNALAEPILDLRPQARALLLYAPLSDYLNSVARKGLEGRLWVRTLLLGLHDDGLLDLGFDVRALLGQTDLQVAATGWLAQHALFARLHARYGARVATLDSATLTADPRAAMAALARHFGMALDDAGLAEMLAGPAFTSHSKTGARFGATERAAEQRDAAEVHADEIAKAAAWAEAVAKAAGVAMVPPGQLLA